jgi:hypothetical protein
MVPRREPSVFGPRSRYPFAGQPVGALLRAPTGFFIFEGDMKSATVVLMFLLAALFAQAPIPTEVPPRHDEEPARLPNGKLQSDEILKDDYQKNLKDAQDLIDLAQSLKASIERGRQHVLSLGDLKKTEEIEKLAKRIRGRMRRY